MNFKVVPGMCSVACFISAVSIRVLIILKPNEFLYGSSLYVDEIENKLFYPFLGTICWNLLPIQSLFICHHNMITHGLECFCTSNHHLVRRRTLAGLQTNVKNWFGWMRNCVSTKFSLRILHQNVPQRITKSMILVQQGVRLRPIRNGRFLHKKNKEKVREEEKEPENKAPSHIM